MSISGTSYSYEDILKYPEINKLTFQENESFHTFDVNEFKEIKTIGRGMFTVKLYEYKPRENFPIAIKIIPVHKSYKEEEEKRLKRLIREIENLKKVQAYPNIIQLYGLCLNKDKDEAWICMEFMDMTLHDFYLKSHKYCNIFPETELGCIVVKIIDALQYCKSKEIIHRDLKPQNILINKAGDIKLCDFGEARVLEESLASTHVGTFAYWPPEWFVYAENNSNKSSTSSLNIYEYDYHYDIRSDIWSLGITLVEVVYGKLPYKALEENINDIILYQIIKNINGNELINRFCQNKCSSDLCLFINVCLSKVEERPRSYDDLQKLQFYGSYKKLEGIEYIKNFFKGLQEKENLDDVQMDQPDNNRNVITVKRVDNNALISNASLLSAARENNIDLVRTLLEQCADPNIKGDRGNTALHFAAFNNGDNYLLVELLLEYDADIDSENESGVTSLMIAAYWNNIEIIRYLLQNRADINREDKYRQNVLHYAAGNKDDNKLIIELLLEHGADKDSQNENGVTCLMTAAENSNIEIARCLLQNGANINKKNNDGKNVLQYAAGNKNDNKFIIELLLEYGADINRQNKGDFTYLMTAASYDNIETIRCLLQNGADINREDKYRQNVLHYAAGNKNDNKFIIELLLKNGADIDSQNEDGKTCLMYAAENNNIKIARCLLQNGADRNKQNRSGETAIQIARKNGKDNKEIVDLLLYYEEEKSKPSFLTKIFKFIIGKE